VDQTGRAGPWAAFGGNAETVSDFRVAVTVTQLAFTVPPSTTAAGAAVTPAVQVTAQDALGATVVSFTGDVTVALATNPAGGTLGGTTTLAAVNGVATFANLTIERVGQGYTLRASTGALSQTSAPFEITTAAAGKLAMVTQPSAAAQSGVAFSTQPAVQVQDPSGNPVADPNVVVTAVIASGPSGATLASASATTSSSGRATFSGLAISGPTGSYTLSFVASGLAPVSSNGITLAAGPASARRRRERGAPERRAGDARDRERRPGVARRDPTPHNNSGEGDAALGGGRRLRHHGELPGRSGRDLERRARLAQGARARPQRVALPHALDREVRKRGHTVHRGERRGAAQCAAGGVRGERHRHVAGEA